jgi:hypothetical protein
MRLLAAFPGKHQEWTKCCSQRPTERLFPPLWLRSENGMHREQGTTKKRPQPAIANASAPTGLPRSIVSRSIVEGGGVGSRASRFCPLRLVLPKQMGKWGQLFRSRESSRRSLIPVFANLLSSTLLSQSLLQPFSFARIQMKGMALHILNDVFRHNFALEASERVLQRLAFL